MPRPIATYWPALAAVVVAGVARWLLNPWLGTNLPFFTLYFAVIFAAWFGGLKPGLLAVALGFVEGTVAFADPAFVLPTGDLIDFLERVRFVVVGVCVSVICEALHRQRRRAEAQTELMRVTLAGIGDAVITTDSGSRITFMNPAAEVVTGWTLREALGLQLESVFTSISEESHQPVESPSASVLRDGAVVGPAEHTVLIRKDGTSVPVDHRAAPIKGTDGTIIGCVLVFRDVTDRNRVEDALREADHRKDEFLAILAHELRNPLAPIRTSLELLKRASGDAAVIQQARATMERQVLQLVRLVDDLIDVGRITRNRLELKREPIELASVVHHAVEACRAHVESAGHELTIALPSRAVRLHADPIRLAQVFENLLTNACKFTEPGGRIRLTAERQEHDVVVTVEDTGVGIPPDMLPKVFDLFTQVDGSLDRSAGGLGIGLSLVRQLVQMHGGSVEARSEGVGTGSTFVVRLPAVAEEPDAALPEPAVARAATRPRRILIVDDNRDAAASLAGLLAIAGHETFTAHDGVDGWEAAERLRPDAMLLDIGLPKLNGYELCRRVREQPWGRDMAIVAVTGWGQAADRRRSQEAGFDAHVVKPVDHAALEALLQDLRPPGTAT